MFCQYCGTKLPDEVKFCTSCGKQVSVPKQAAPAAEAEPAFEPRTEPVYVQPQPEPVYVQSEPVYAQRVQPDYRPAKSGLPFNIVATVFALVAVVGMFLKMISIYGIGNSLFQSLIDSFTVGDLMGGFEGVLVVLTFAALVLMIVLTFITSFLRRRTSMVFALIGVILLVALAVLLGSVIVGEFTFELIGYMAIGYYLMLGGLLLNFIAQLFYHPNR